MPRPARCCPQASPTTAARCCPIPIYADRAAGPRKWDVDGNEYVDYFGGHGALLLGHGHPAVLEAVASAAPARHALGRLPRARGALGRADQPPAAVRGDACASPAPAPRPRTWRCGSPAPSPAKPKVIRFVGHFHGWHDGVAAGAMSHFEGGVPAGIPAGLVEQTILLPADDRRPRRRDAGGARRRCGGHAGAVRRFLGPGSAAAGLPRRAARASRASMASSSIFDEVITGFRWSRGGAQARYGITPDLCILAKIVAGGLPGGAVAGRADILDQLDRRRPPRRQAARRSATRAPSTPIRCARLPPSPRSRIVEREDVCARGRAHGRSDPRGHAHASSSRSRSPGASTARPRPSSSSRTPSRLDDRSRHVRSARARLQGPQGRAQPRSRLPPAHRHARQRRRHHGRAGRPGLGRARAARGGAHARGLPHAPCAGSRPRVTFDPESLSGRGNSRRSGCRQHLTCATPRSPPAG